MAQFQIRTELAAILMPKGDSMNEELGTAKSYFEAVSNEGKVKLKIELALAVLIVSSSIR